LKDKEVYLHIGYPKTGSTFLQKAIFPFFESTDYFHSQQTFTEIVWQAVQKKLFISHECFSGAPVRTVRLGPKGWINSRNQRLGFLASIFPSANIILVFRPHGEWLSSMYRQYLYQGGALSYESFFSLDEDLLIERDGLFYQNIFNAVKEQFNGRILCINYKGLRKNPEKIYTALEEFIGAKLIQKGKPEVVHPSAKRLQARMLRWFNRYIEPSYLEPRDIIILKRINGIPWKLGLTPVHFIRRMKFLGKIGKDVVPLSKIEEAQTYYSADWKWVKDNVGEYTSVF